MDSGLNEEHRDLADAVRGALERSREVIAWPDVAGSFDRELWSTLCDQVGIAALAVPEEHGGFGFSYLESHIVLEQLGYALSSLPFLGSAVLAAQALMAVDATESTTAILTGIASGETIAALCWADANGRWLTDESDVVASGDPHTLDGESTLVVDGPRADLLLVIATTNEDRMALFAVVPGAQGVRVEERVAVDMTLSIATVKFAGVGARLLGVFSPAALESLLDIATTATTALQVGVGQRGLDMTIAYSKEREQFGRPIGSFQALKHRMADVYVKLEAARSVSLAAAQRIASSADDSQHWADTAKAWCTEAANLAAAETIQIHGGIAITWEHDAHVVFKRAHALAQLFGGAREHRQRLANVLLATQKPVQTACG